jgi:hypothetical protein
MAGMSRLLMVMVVALLVVGTAGPLRAQEGGAMMPEVHTNLYATLEFLDFKKMDSTFDARNIELLVAGRMGPRLSGNAEVEYERGKTIGEGNGAVEVEQGWVQYEIDSFANLRTGVILVPFGNYNLTHFDPFQDLTSRPLVAQSVVPTTWAEAGAGIVGSVFPSENSVVDYQIYFVNGLADAMNNTEGLHDDGGNFETDNNNNKGVVGRVAVSSGRNRIAGSAYHGAYDRSGNQISGFDADGMVVVGPLEVLGEWARFNVEHGLTADGDPTPRNLQGAYVQANYHFWFDFLNQTFLGRQFDDPTFTLVARWGFARIAVAGAGPDNRETRATFGLNYRPTVTFVYKVEYQANNTRRGGEPLQLGDLDGVVASVTAAF